MQPKNISGLAFGLQRIAIRYCSRALSTVSVGGYHSVHIERRGSGQNGLIMLPGALGTAKNDFGFQFQQFPELLGPDWSIISFDPRGYGQTAKDGESTRDWHYEAEKEVNGDINPWSFYNRDAEDAATVMEQLGFSTYSVLGWSDGANSAAWVAANHPDKVQRLIMYAGNAYLTEADLDAYEKTKDTSKWPEKMRAPMEKIYGDKLQSLWGSWVDALKKILNGGGVILPVHELHKIVCNTLIMHGDKDPLVPEEHPLYFARHIKKSQLFRMPEGRHNAHQHPASSEEFNQTVANFLQS